VSSPGISLLHEEVLWKSGVAHVAGVDEAGRGPLAGPVVAAAVIFPPGLRIPGVNDSKKLSPARREELFGIIHAEVLAVGVGIVGHVEIDTINILQATYKAMHIALASLAVVPDHILVDGNRFSGTGVPFTAIVDGDACCHAIAAASIIAKVTRDRLMLEFDQLYPGYGFARHRGYGTAAHREAIVRLGPCPIHRRTFLHMPSWMEVQAEAGDGPMAEMHGEVNAGLGAEVDVTGGEGNDRFG
jgi:ribonuclease HII